MCARTAGLPHTWEPVPGIRPGADSTPGRPAGIFRKDSPVARLFDSPMMLLVILLVILLLFGAPKLPGMARSLGQSMRIFKSEVKEMKADGKTETKSSTTPAVEGEVIASPAASTISADGEPAHRS